MNVLPVHIILIGGHPFRFAHTVIIVMLVTKSFVLPVVFVNRVVLIMLTDPALLDIIVLVVLGILSSALEAIIVLLEHRVVLNTHVLLGITVLLNLDLI